MELFNPKPLSEVQQEKSKDEEIDLEKVAMAEAIVNLNLEVESLKQQINGGTI